MAVVAQKDELVFTYQGKDKQGRMIRGEVVGRSEAVVRARLRKQGINPNRIKRKRKNLGGKKITPGDIAVFARQLTTMMRAGVPMVQSFEIVGRGHENPNMQQLILAIKTDVEGGISLADAMEKHPLHFDDLFVQLVRAGEQSGALENLLDKVATYKEKNEALKGKIKKALFYPAAVVVVSIIVTAILLLFVVPQFEQVFSSFGAELPAFTKLVINMSEWLQSYWFIILVIVGGVGYAFAQAHKRSPQFRRLLDRVVLRLPIVGEILSQATIARFANTMSTMFAAGVPLVEAMQSVAKASGNIIYEEAVMRMRDDIAAGMQLQASMRTHGADLFPNMVVQMVAIGEESGQLDGMLNKVSEFFEEQVDNSIDGLTSLLEPLIMAFLGIVVGGLVIAMYLPIFKLGSVV